MRKKRIIFLMDCFNMGGTEIVLKNLLDQLKLHNDLEISVCGRLRERYFTDWLHANRNTIRHYNCKLRMPSLRKNIVLRLFGLAWRAIAKVRIRQILSNQDVIVDFKGGMFHKVLRKSRGRKIGWIHGGIGNYTNHFNPAIAEYDKMICLTKSFKDDFDVMFPKYSDKMFHIYNAVQHKDIMARALSQKIPDGKYFVYAGRIDIDKDIATLIIAFDKFWRGAGRPDVLLYIIGSGPRKQVIQELSAVLESDGNIIFTGIIPEPFGYMRGALANILSSHQEGLPTVLIEAAACETLNISSDCKSGPKEILLNGSAGLLFPAGDSDALAHIMSDVYNEKVDREKMIAAGTLGLSRFDADYIARKVLEIL